VKIPIRQNKNKNNKKVCLLQPAEKKNKVSRSIHFFYYYLGHFLFFLRFASVQNCETYPPARGKNKQSLKDKTASACCMKVKHDKNLIYFIYHQTKYSTKSKNKKK
jgi:hypothetical protein